MGMLRGTEKPREGKQPRCPAGGEKRKVLEVKFGSDDKWNCNNPTDIV